MDYGALATLALEGLTKAAELISQAVDNAKNSNEEQARALIDDAIAHLDASIPGTRQQLLALRAGLDAAIKAKFPTP